MCRGSTCQAHERAVLQAHHSATGAVHEDAPGYGSGRKGLKGHEQVRVAGVLRFRPRQGAGHRRVVNHSRRWMRSKGLGPSFGQRLINQDNPPESGGQELLNNSDSLADAKTPEKQPARFGSGS